MKLASGQMVNVWLASYPKSGNTWFRLIWKQLTLDRDQAPLAVSRLVRPASAPQPCHIGSLVSRLGLDPRWLTSDEIDLLRSRIEATEVNTDGWPRLRKTHERRRNAFDGSPLYPGKATRAAILIVRDPRDVACSWAAHFSTTQERAVADICRLDLTWPARSATGSGRQVLGSWSQHYYSWRESVDFPVQVMRYEDLVADPVETVSTAVKVAGLDATRAEVADAVAVTSFEKLRDAEIADGFSERPTHSTDAFFRRGLPGGWRDELPTELARRIETHHAAVMAELGYLAAT